MPSVSVVLPVYNAGATIARAVTSILNQSLRDLELIVIDDGSTDDTPVVLAGILDPRMRVVRTQHQGVAFAANEGTAEARAPLIARMDADDFSYPERLQRQVDLLHQADVDVVGCQVRILSNEGIEVESLQRYQRWVNRDTLAPSDILAYRFVEFPLVNPTILARRRYFELKFCDNRFPEDYEVMLRASQLGMTFAKVPDILFDWHDSSDRLTRRSNAYSNEAFMACRRQYLKSGPLNLTDTVDLWGLGQTGKPWMRWLRGEGIEIRQAFDVDPRKIGQTIHGVCVKDGREIPDSDQVPLIVAVGAAGARRLIRDHIQPRAFIPGENTWFVA